MQEVTRLFIDCLKKKKAKWFSPEDIITALNFKLIIYISSSQLLSIILIWILEISAWVDKNRQMNRHKDT